MSIMLKVIQKQEKDNWAIQNEKQALLDAIHEHTKRMNYFIKFSKILIEKSKTMLKLSKEDIKEYYIQALQLEPKLLIDYLIQEIKVFEDKIEITFNSPIKTSPDNNQGFFVAEFTSKLPQYIQNKTMPNFKEVEIKIYV